MVFSHDFVAFSPFVNPVNRGTWELPSNFHPILGNLNDLCRSHIFPLGFSRKLDALDPSVAKTEVKVEDALDGFGGFI